ncbi:polysaccharide deacetylase family protein [Dactylosporangium sp. NPDC049140]|jgi:peptidoglycan/xylan/chitin deacetylase (PgdA/CDA1 family)|uniref:polysaccharide deacetylase family protein n=1 Tax=Dactylosporangium sp. NPDC049140 TaxID=3155647 RepID=UPI00340289DE
MSAAMDFAATFAPPLTAITPLRRAYMPGLAGIGRPGHVALTFDDGPDRRSTPHILRILREYDVRATFFLLGSMLAEDPQLGRELVDAGHEVAVHGWHHRCLVRRRPAATDLDITRATMLVATVTGQTPRWYRPPYGVFTLAGLRASRRLGLTPVLWTAWGRDWEARATPDSILRTVTRRLSGGGTVLLHDTDITSAPGSWRRTAAALPALLRWTREHGLAVGPLREHQR